jgi:excisionase family DNA binding protein
MARTLETGTSWLTYEEAEEYTGVERTTIWRAMRTGKLRAGRAGRAVRFHRDDLDAWLRGEHSGPAGDGQRL